MTFTEPSSAPWRWDMPTLRDANGELLATIHRNDLDGMLLRISREMYDALEQIAWAEQDAEKMQQIARNALAKRK